MSWTLLFCLLYWLNLKEFTILFVQFIQNYPTIHLPLRVPKGGDNPALNRQCETPYHCYTQAFMQKVNHMSWRGGVDVYFCVSTDERGCLWFGAAIQPNSFRDRGFANIFWTSHFWNVRSSMESLVALSISTVLWVFGEGKYLARVSGPVLTQDSRAGQPVLKQHLQMFGNIWGPWCQSLRTRQPFVDLKSKPSFPFIAHSRHLIRNQLGWKYLECREAGVGVRREGPGQADFSESRSVRILLWCVLLQPCNTQAIWQQWPLIGAVCCPDTLDFSWAPLCRLGRSLASTPALFSFCKLTL